MYNHNKILNYTKHPLCIYRPEDTVPKGRSGYTKLLRKSAKPVPPIIIPPVVPLNANSNKGMGVEQVHNGILFKAADLYFQTIDSFPSACLESDSLIVVSRHYSEAAKNKLSPEQLDRLYVPADEIVRFDGKGQKIHIGCTSFTKVLPFMRPSFYLSKSSDFATKGMAIQYWNLNWQALSQFGPDAQFEWNALKQLEQMVYSQNGFY